MTHKLVALVLALATATAGAAGCGTDRVRRPPGERVGLVDLTTQPPFVHSLDVEPGTGDYLMTTNRGFFRIDPDTDRVTPIRGTAHAGTVSSPVGSFLSFLPVGEGKLIGSGHPDRSRPLPQFLGLMRSDDAGRTWRVTSRLGSADLHKLILAHGKLYAWDAVLSAIVVSEDGGRQFREHFTPDGLVIDFVVDPEDPEYLIAATEKQLFSSLDEGERWRPVEVVAGARLVWPRRDSLYRATKDGTVSISRDRGKTFRKLGAVEGEPYKLKALDATNILMARSDASILESRDGARTWTTAFTP